MERISDQPTDSEARTDSEPESSSLSISHNAGASFTNEIPMSVECTETSQAAAPLPQLSTTESNSGQPAQLQHQCNEDVLSAQQEEGNRTAPLIAHPLDDPDQGVMFKGRQSVKPGSMETMPTSLQSAPRRGSSVPRIKQKVQHLDPHARRLLENVPRPPRLVDDPQNVSSEDLHKAHGIVSEVIKRGPKALGIVLLAHHQGVPMSVELQSLDGIETGTDRLYDCFTNLGLAVVRLENPSTQEIKAVMKIMSSPVHQLDPKYRITYPPSYKLFFFYTTGHGARRVFFTKDCAVAYSTVYELFQGLFVQRYFFFDCCRCVRLDDISLYTDQEGHRELPEIPGHGIQAGNKIVYATLDGRKAYGPATGPDKGVSFMTLKMIDLLKQQISIDEIINKLVKDLPKEVELFQQPMSVDAASLDYKLFAKRDKEMKPMLQQEPVISSEGFLAHFHGILAQPLVRSDSFNVESTFIKMKTDNGNWTPLEDEIRTRAKTIPPSRKRRSWTIGEALQSVSLTDTPCTHPGSLQNSIRDGLQCRSSSSLEELEAGSEPRVVTVALPIRRPVNKKSEFRFVVRYSGGVEIESDVLSYQLPPIVAPIIESASVTGYSCRHGISVTWTVHPDVQAQRFTVAVRTPEQLIGTAIVEVEDRSKQKYACTFGLKNYDEKQVYLVEVTAERTGNMMVSSRPHGVTKGFWFKYYCRISTLVFLALLLVSILVPVSLLCRNTAKMLNNDSCNFNPPGATMSTIFEARSGTILEEKCDHQQVILSQPDLYHQSVSRNTKGFGQSVHCAEFSNAELDNTRNSNDLGPDDIYINQLQPQSLSQSTEFLPLGGGSPSYKYLLSKSVFTVYLCVTGPILGAIPQVEVLLFRFKDSYNLQNAQPLERAEILFNKSLCSNTSITLSQSALVIAALSTPSSVTLMPIKGYMKEYYYNEKIRSQLVNKTNLIDYGTMIQIEGGYFSKLLCCVEGGVEGTPIAVPLFNIIIPFIRSPWVLRGLLSIIAFLFLLVIISIIVFCLRKHCKQFLNQSSCTRGNAGYTVLNQFSNNQLHEDV